jgi:hypothetical protein
MSADGAISEEVLRGLFGYYGPVLDCAIKKLRRDPVSRFRANRGFSVSNASLLSIKTENQPREGICFHQLPRFWAGAGRQDRHRR